MAAPIGNQNASKSRLVHDELRKLAAQDNFKRLRAGLNKVMNAFEAGEPWAAQFVRDSLDGRPAVAVTVTSDDTPVISMIRMVIVPPPNEIKLIEGENVVQEAPPPLPPGRSF